MTSPSLNRRVATSMLTLPAAALLSAALWVAGGFSPARTGGLAAAVLTIYMVAELNNRFSLLRVRSRMMSSTLALMLAVDAGSHAWSAGALVPAGLLAAAFLLFEGYGKPVEPGFTFHAMLAVSLTAFVFPPVLLLVPVWLFSAGVHLQMLSWRSFLAAVCGLLLPWWLCGAWVVWSGTWAEAAARAGEWLQTPGGIVLGLAAWTPERAAQALLLLAASAVGAVHLWCTANDDKLRPRAALQTLSLQWVASVALVALWPGTAAWRVFMLFSAMLAGHGFATTEGRGAARWFGLCLTATAALAAAQLCGLWKLWPAF